MISPAKRIAAHLASSSPFISVPIESGCHPLPLT